MSSLTPTDAPAQAQAEGEAAAPADRVLYRKLSVLVYGRVVVLPSEVDQTASQAKFENGVLTLTLAKKFPAGAAQLSIA